MPIICCIGYSFGVIVIWSLLSLQLKVAPTIPGLNALRVMSESNLHPSEVPDTPASKSSIQSNHRKEMLRSQCYNLYLLLLL